MLATSNGGVIGFVTKVYDDTTTISLLSSSSSDSYLASSVRSEDDNQIFGIISRYDNKKKLLEMTQLNSSSNVKVGTEVVTRNQIQSGHGKSPYDHPDQNVHVGTIIFHKSSYHSILLVFNKKQFVLHYNAKGMWLQGERRPLRSHHS